MKCYNLLPSECYVPSLNWGSTLGLVIHTDCSSRLISRPDVSTSCELAAVTSLICCLILKFQLTYPANFCGFFLVINIYLFFIELKQRSYAKPICYNA